MPMLDEIDELIDVYQKAQANLLAQIAAIEADGNVATYQRKILAGVQQELTDLISFSTDWFNKNIPDAYDAGIVSAYETYKEQFSDITKATADTDVIQTMIENANGQLTDGVNYIGRRVYDEVRSAGFDAVTQGLAQQDALSYTKSAIMAAFDDRGIMSITDKNGRSIQLDVYASMLARTLTREATNSGIMAQVRDFGGDLVEMDTTATCCEICAIYEGRVYSLSGEDKRFPSIEEVPGYGDGYVTIHPNCTHTLMPYVEELDENFDDTLDFSNRPFELTDENKEMLVRYYEEQKEKADRRADRREWQESLLYAPDATPSTFSAFRSMKRADSEKYQDLKYYVSETKSIIKMIEETQIYGGLAETVGNYTVEEKTNQSITVVLSGNPIDVYKNITPEQLEQMELSMKMSLKGMGEDYQDPSNYQVRMIIMANGDTYTWNADDAMHAEMEGLLTNDGMGGYIREPFDYDFQQMRLDEVQDYVNNLNQTLGISDRADEVTDSNVYIPEQTITAYKMFDVDKYGNLHAIMIDKNEALPLGAWIEAEANPTKGFAPRPGWHALPLPYEADALLDKTGPNAGNMDVNRVWAQVTISADVNYNEYLQSSGEKQITDHTPEEGYYNFRPNKSYPQDWFIAGSLRIDRVLTNEEVAAILTAGGAEDKIDQEIASDSVIERTAKYTGEALGMEPITLENVNDLADTEVAPIQFWTDQPNLFVHMSDEPDFRFDPNYSNERQEFGPGLYLAPVDKADYWATALDSPAYVVPFDLKDTKLFYSDDFPESGEISAKLIELYGGSAEALAAVEAEQAKITGETFGNSTFEVAQMRLYASTQGYDGIKWASSEGVQVLLFNTDNAYQGIEVTSDAFFDSVRYERLHPEELVPETTIEPTENPVEEVEEIITDAERSTILPEPVYPIPLGGHNFKALVPGLEDPISVERNLLDSRRQHLYDLAVQDGYKGSIDEYFDRAYDTQGNVYEWERGTATLEQVNTIGANRGPGAQPIPILYETLEEAKANIDPDMVNVFTTNMGSTVIQNPTPAQIDKYLQDTTMNTIATYDGLGNLYVYKIDNALPSTDEMFINYVERMNNEISEMIGIPVNTSVRVDDMLRESDRIKNVDIGDGMTSTDVLKNPTNLEVRKYIGELAEEYGMTPLEIPLLNVAYDEDGNVYVWDGSVSNVEENDRDISQGLGFTINRFNVFPGDEFIPYTAEQISDKTFDAMRIRTETYMRLVETETEGFSKWTGVLLMDLDGSGNWGQWDPENGNTIRINREGVERYDTTLIHELVHSVSEPDIDVFRSEPYYRAIEEGMTNGYAHYISREYGVMEETEKVNTMYNKWSAALESIATISSMEKDDFYRELIDINLGDRPDYIVKTVTEELDARLNSGESIVTVYQDFKEGENSLWDLELNPNDFPEFWELKQHVLDAVSAEESRYETFLKQIEVSSKAELTKAYAQDEDFKNIIDGLITAANGMEEELGSLMQLKQSELNDLNLTLRDIVDSALDMEDTTYDIKNPYSPDKLLDLNASATDVTNALRAAFTSADAIPLNEPLYFTDTLFPTASLMEEIQKQVEHTALEPFKYEYLGLDSEIINAGPSKTIVSLTDFNTAIKDACGYVADQEGFDPNVDFIPVLYKVENGPYTSGTFDAIDVSKLTLDKSTEWLTTNGFYINDLSGIRIEKTNTSYLGLSGEDREIYMIIVTLSRT